MYVSCVAGIYPAYPYDKKKMGNVFYNCKSKTKIDNYMFVGCADSRLRHDKHTRT